MAPEPSEGEPDGDRDAALPGRPHVVLAYDGAEASRPALRWAAVEARRRGSTLRVVSVAEHPVLRRGRASDLVRSWEEARDTAARSAASGAALAAALVPGVDVEPVARVGSAASVLVGESARAAVLVARRQAFADVVRRTPELRISEQVWSVLMRRSRVPVVLVGARPRQAGRRVPVVVGVDGSREAWHAAEWAAAFAAGSQALLRVVCVWVPLTARTRASAAQSGPRRHDPTSPEAAGEVVAEVVERVGELFPDLPIETVARSGSADRVLARASRAAALLVLGRRGHGSAHSLVLGSVSARTLRLVGLPVVFAAAPWDDVPVGAEVEVLGASLRTLTSRGSGRASGGVAYRAAGATP